ncbi:hypothetical protein BSKO_11247 [Bryopsis sp. KO-2023]|nr:hypothetical protein BSKO_11247 [Bryopsis sp. KO-2023]
MQLVRHAVRKTVCEFGKAYPSAKTRNRNLADTFLKEETRSGRRTRCSNLATGAMDLQFNETNVRVSSREIIPQLTGDLYKGDLGRVGIVGGCREYTGAPYFGAFSALRLGADLSHVFCSRSAADIIKGYSPELIVHPYLYESEHLMESDDSFEFAQKAAEEVSDWFSRLDCLVVGPGLGRDPLNLECARLIIHAARVQGIPLVIDADGLHIVTVEPALITGCENVILTPNLNELHRLAFSKMKTPSDAIKGNASIEARRDMAYTLAMAFNGPTIVSKGATDIICCPEGFVECTVRSANRRCGGLGDVMAGCLAVFVSWEKRHSRMKEAEVGSFPDLVSAAYGACSVVRLAASNAFMEKGRSMLCGDVIEKIGLGLCKLESGGAGG